jgi:hypothetical protein
VCLCDNQAVVACLRSRTSRVAHIVHLLRTLAFIEARCTFSLTPQYIDTKSTIWLMTYQGIFFPPFSRRSHTPTPRRPHCQHTFWIFSWTQPSTGPRRVGSSCSAILQGWACPLYQALL